MTEKQMRTLGGAMVVLIGCQVKDKDYRYQSRLLGCRIMGINSPISKEDSDAVLKLVLDKFCLDFGL